MIKLCTYALAAHNSVFVFFPLRAPVLAAQNMPFEFSSRFIGVLQPSVRYEE